MTAERVCIVGAGISGATIARRLAEAGWECDVLEARDHLGGNCHTEWDKASGCYKHVYGPHIFHTDKQNVVGWVQRFATLLPYKHSVKSTYGGRVYSLPINLHTINQFFEAAWAPAEAGRHLRDARDSSSDMNESFETRALALVGPEIYEAFFKGYTKKQWGVDPRRIPADILKRLPIRLNYDDNYFHHSFQALPQDGYTAMIEAMLDHPKITVNMRLNANYSDIKNEFGRVFWSGPLDAIFDADEGFLPYRTLDFKFSHEDGDFQGCPVMNYPEESFEFTRISQFNYFRPTNDTSEIKTSLIAREYSREWKPGDIHYYPVHLNSGETPLKSYQDRASKIEGLHLFGRLGRFQYIDMDVAIDQALHLADTVLGD